MDPSVQEIQEIRTRSPSPVPSHIGIPMHTNINSGIQIQNEDPPEVDLNLAGSNIEYSEDGGVEFEFEREPSDDGPDPEVSNSNVTNATIPIPTTSIINLNLNSNSKPNSNSSAILNLNSSSIMKVQTCPAMTMPSKSEYDPHRLRSFGHYNNNQSLVPFATRDHVVDHHAVTLGSSAKNGGSGGRRANGAIGINSDVDLSITGKHHALIGGGRRGSFLEPGLLNLASKSRTSKKYRNESIGSLILPSNIAIPIGLAMVFVGLSMVISGAFALRFQSYLFYYGSGLWAGTLAGLAGILGVMATKKGLKKPAFLCGGKRWQIHVFLLAVMLSLCTSILAAILATSGLIRDTQRDLSQDLEDMTAHEEMHERRKSSGIAINAFLLLFSLLQILLSLFSLGLALRVFCARAYCSHNGSLLSSDGSEVTVRDILGDGTGPEYEARKDRLLRWLGHQRRHFFAGQSKAAIMAAKGRHHTNTLLSNASNAKGNFNTTFDPRLIPTFVTSTHQRSRSNAQQYQVIHPSSQYSYNSLPYVIPSSYGGGRNPCPPAILGPHSLPYISAYPAHPQMMVPVVPLPVRQPRPQTPMSMKSGGSRGGASGPSEGGASECGKKKAPGKRRYIFGSGGGARSVSGGSSLGGISKRSSSKYGSTSSRSRKSRKGKIDKNLKNKKIIVESSEVSEEEVGRTYTGLDRQVAEDFISNSMDTSRL